MIRRAAGFACTVALTLSVGIGIATAIFGLLNRFVFPAAVRDDPQFFMLQGALTFPRYVSLRDQVRAVQDLAAWSVPLTGPLTAPLGPEDSAAPVQAMLVSCNFFRAFGVDKPLAGALFRGEACVSAHTVMVISEKLWRERFSADPNIAGEPLLYGGRPVTIIGVAAAPLADAWFPYTIQPHLKNSLTSFENKDLLKENDIAWLSVAGRLRTGYSLEAAAAEIRRIEPALVLTSRGGQEFPSVLSIEVLAVAAALPVLVLLLSCVGGLSFAKKPAS